jgi:hypothetical protein
MWQADPSPRQDSLLNALAGDPKVAFVQLCRDAKVSITILVRSVCRTSHHTVSLDRPCAVLERAAAADKAAKLERCKLGGKNGSTLGTTDMSAKHRALPETQQKLKDAGLDPATASKHALGGKTAAAC